MPPAALSIHLCIGQVYALSVFKKPLVERFGTSETRIAVIFSIAIVMLGLAAAFGGPWMERNGPRKAMALSALCFGTGFLVAALGVSTGQLWLVYLGYGVIGGIGLGIGYISPVSTLIKWFPDRPGLATGMAIMGFGGGAFIAAALSDRLLSVFTSVTGGAIRSDAIAPAFVVLGIGYFLFMLIGVFTVRVPPADYRPSGYDPATAKKSTLYSGAQLTANEAIRTWQFWALWVVLFTNVTAGIGILEQAAVMIQDFFSGVTAAEAAGYVGVLSLCNMAGRFVWSSASDYLGRKNTYWMYLGVGALLFFLVTTVGSSSLVLFVLLTGAIISFYGGGFATVPAYLKDLFGTREVGAIHGRLLTAWSAAGVAGPLIINVITDGQKNAGKTGAGAYALSLYVVIGLLVIGFIANTLVRSLGSGHSAGVEDRETVSTGGTR